MSKAKKDFEILEGLDGLRKNPTMYLGSLGQTMVHRCIKEPVDNAYDEWIAGRNKLIEVIVDLDSDRFVIADGGKGIPTEKKKLRDGTKISILTAAFARTHAGGKFNDRAYKTSAGTHGIGVSAVNAVSSEMTVWSNYRGKCVGQSFVKGVAQTDDPKPMKVDPAIRKLLANKPAKYGTIVTFVLDQSVVSESSSRGKKLPQNYVKAVPDTQKLATDLRYVAFLNPGLLIRLTVKKKKKVKSWEFLNKKGLKWIPQYMCEAHELGTMGRPLVFKSDNITCSVIWTDQPDSDNFLSFVNTSPTVDGGWHVTGFMTALSQSLKPFVKTKKGFSSSDLLIGLTGMFDWRMHGAQFTSQIKDKLASRVDTEVHKQMLPVFVEYFKKNGSVARAIIKRAQAMDKGRKELAMTVKSLASAKKATRANTLPASLAVAPRCSPDKRELFIVEGESASNTAKNARDATFQEVLAAKGKPLNGLKAPLAKVLAHTEIQNLMLAIGADLRTLNVKQKNPTLATDKLRINSLILLADPDPDGGHIAVLYLAIIYRLMPDLLKQRRVWAVKAPLFASLQDKRVYGGPTLEQCLANCPKGTKASQVTRIKGWGEVDERWLGPIAFDKEQRNLICINPFEDAEAERFFRGVVAEDAVYRRQLLGLEK